MPRHWFRPLSFALLLVAAVTAPFQAFASEREEDADDQGARLIAPLDGAGRMLPLWFTASAARDAIRAKPPFAAPEAREQAVESGEPRPDFPEELLRERWEMMSGGDPNVTMQAMIDAKVQLERNDASLRRSGAFGALDAGLGAWEWMGPDNVGGRTRAILFDPNDANHLWAGTASGGISTSFDGGFSWSIVDDFLPSLSVTSLVIDTNTGTLFASTGETAVTGTSTGGGMLGAGIFRSTDGGVTWVQLPATAPWSQVTRLAVVPGDGFLYAATSNGVFRSSNSGDTWSQVDTNVNLTDVKATATSHLVLVGSTSGAFRSGDSGITWTTLTTGGTNALPNDAGRIEFAIAPDQTTCYASVNRNQGEVWRSLDAGVTWTRRRTGDNYLQSQGNYDNAIWVDPTNSNVVVVAGIDAWRSNDGGATFTKISNWQSYPGPSAHADHHVIVSHPGYNGSSNRQVYFGNDGGVQRKDDILAGDTGWTNLSNGLKSTQFYKGAIQSGTNELMGGLQDNGTWRRTSSNTWVSRYGGDGGFCGYDAGGTTMFWEYVRLEMYRNGIFELPSACFGGITDAQSPCNARFIAPFRPDPVVVGRVFAGGISIWRSSDAASSWTSVRGPIASRPNPSPSPGCATLSPRCSAIELVSSNSQLVWVGYDDGTVSRSTDNGATWTNVINGVFPSVRVVTDIAVNPSNTNEAWVTFGGFQNSNVRYTADGGATWSTRTGSGSTALPVAPVETITIHPTNRSWIYAGTSLGVLASQDKGLHWGLMRSHENSEGPAYTQVSDLVWEGNRLIAFTYGRGVWRSGPLTGATTGPSFALLGTSLPGAQSGSCDWGDYDADGDLDVVWTGNTAPSDTLEANPGTTLARNDGAGAFTPVPTSLPHVADGAARWGDFDADGDLDVAVTGMLGGGDFRSAIYRNANGSFIDTYSSLTPVSKSDQVWGDFDNDGDLDLVVSGRTAPTSTNTGLTRMYLNDHGNFSVAAASFASVQHSSLDAGDYDNDGDLDLLLAGWQGSTTTPITLLYRNDGGGSFTSVAAGLPAVEFSAEWGDYDEDGDLDILLMGSNALWVIRNNGGGIFVPIQTLAQQLDGQAAWGDYDNDGDLDIAVTGKDGLVGVTRLYRNDAGTYADTGARLGGARRSSLSWADYDNDGDVDLFLMGWQNVANTAQVYRNDIATTNTPPWAPTGLTATTSGCVGDKMAVTFSWGASPQDDHTSLAAIGYNLRVGTSPGASDVMPPHSYLDDGFRRVAARGNAQLRRSWTLLLPAGTYYWGVQAIDGSMKASVFSGTVSRITTNYTDALSALTPTRGAVSWGDYDGDDDLDLAITGLSGSNVYRNEGNGSTFTPAGAGLPALDYSANAWGDYDGDGDLDLAVSGCTPGNYVARIYRNTGGTFADIGAGLPGVCGGTLAWADIDHDGDLDLLLTGETGAGVIARIYLNDVGNFYDLGAPLTGVNLGQSAWGDFDGDGDPDLLLTGRDDLGARHADLYRNDAGGAFVSVYSGLPPTSFGAVAWADYDRDGDQDLLLAGSTGVGADQFTRVFRSEGDGTFTDTFQGMPGMQEGSADWGDLDNDGRLDLLLTGYNPQVGGQTRVFMGSASGNFLSVAGTGLPSLFSSDADLGDFDGDGTLDVVLIGGGGAPIAKVYRGCGALPNAPPEVPAGLAWTRNGDQLTLSWNAANDDHNSAGAGLTYNVRVGTSPGGQQVLSAMSNTGTGFHRVPRAGNAQGRLSTTLTLPDVRYYWSVQAVDAAYRTSAFAAPQTLGIELQPIPAGIPALYRSAVAWGDYDNDGDLDLLMAGTNGFGPLTKLYRNDAGTFVDANAGLPNVEWCSLDWGDYDRDGDLDIAICGWNAGPLVSRIYRNDAGTFTDIAAGMPGLIYGTVAWGDCDGDGDLDLFLAGYDGTVHTAWIWVQRNGRFTPKIQLEGVAFSSADWGDFDDDGDMDLAVMGHNGTQGVAHVYRNTPPNFVDAGYNVPGAWEGSLAWGDYDADGDLDLLMVGWTGSVRFSKVFRNADNLLLDIGAGLESVSSSRAAWGDYDNDGDLDIALTGYTDAGTGLTRVYRKDSGGYMDSGILLPGTYYSAIAWGDFDNDRDLDLALTGINGVAGIFMNDGAPANEPPSAPTNLTSSVNGNLLTLSWSAATDDHTPPAGLSYNVRVGTTPGGNEIASPMARADGWRKVTKLGNSQLRLTIPLTVPQTAGYWSVQAVDGAFVGSAFAAEIPTVVGADVAAAPALDALGPAKPNPMLASTNLSLALARTGPVEIEVFDITGQRVATLFRGNMAAGYRSLRWEPKRDDGVPLAAGVYLMRMKTPQSVRAMKLVVMR